MAQTNGDSQTLGQKSESAAWKPPGVELWAIKRVAINV